MESITPKFTEITPFKSTNIKQSKKAKKESEEQFFDRMLQKYSSTKSIKPIQPKINLSVKAENNTGETKSFYSFYKKPESEKSPDKEKKEIQRSSSHNFIPKKPQNFYTPIDSKKISSEKNFLSLNKKLSQEYKRKRDYQKILNKNSKLIKSNN